MSPGWVSVIIGAITVISSISCAWAVVQVKVSRLEEDRKVSDEKAEKDRKAFTSAIADIQKSFSASVDSLKDTIREEIERAMSRTNNLLFKDGGRPRYMLREECKDCRLVCSEANEKRLSKLEEKSHDHQ